MDTCIPILLCLPFPAPVRSGSLEKGNPSSGDFIVVEPSGKTSDDDGTYPPNPCKTPDSTSNGTGGSSLTFASLPSSGSSSSRSSSPTSSETSRAHGPDRKNASNVNLVVTGVKRPMQTSPEMSGSGSIGDEMAAARPMVVVRPSDGSGGGKRPKVAKERISLQERMSRLRKDFAQKKKSNFGVLLTPASSVVLPAAAEVETTQALKPAAIANDGEAAALSSMVSSSLMLPVVAAASTATASTSGGVPASVFLPSASVVSAPSADKGKASLETVLLSQAPTPGVLSAPVAASSTVTVENNKSTQGIKKATAVDVLVPPATEIAPKKTNIISGVHSLTSLLSNRNGPPAPMGKWDRLAAGGGATARPVPALRKAEEARLLEARRARARATGRVKVPVAGQPVTAVEGIPAKPSIVPLAGAKPVASDRESSASGSSSSSTRQPTMSVPLRVTGMLPKLVPTSSGVAREVAGAAPQKATQPALTSLALPLPFRRSMDGGVDVEIIAATSHLSRPRPNEGDTSILKSIGSTTSSSSASSGGGRGAGSSATLSSDKIEMKIMDQRAQIALKRNARMEKLRAAEERKKVCALTL